MAIVIPGKTTCPICGCVIGEGDEMVAFAPFVLNEADPLILFSDAACHRRCFESHPLSGQCRAVYEEFRKRLIPTQRTCAECGEEISGPDEYFPLGYLTSDTDHPLFRFNHLQFHRSCLAESESLTELFEALDQALRSGEFTGLGAESLRCRLEELMNPQPSPRP